MKIIEGRFVFCLNRYFGMKKGDDFNTTLVIILLGILGIGILVYFIAL